MAVAIALLAKALATVSALIRPDAGVRAYVLEDVALFEEHLATLLAFEHLVQTSCLIAFLESLCV